MTALSNYCTFRNHTKLPSSTRKPSLQQKCEPKLALKPLPTQVAGHGSQGDGQRGILKRSNDGKLLKPLQPPPKGSREATFYTRINQSSDPLDIQLRRHIPKFYGIDQLGMNEEYLVLEDITDGLLAPCVMDVKLGRQTWNPEASEAKRRQEMSKYKGTKGPLGFSVLGLIVQDSSRPMRKLDKSFGNALNVQNVHQVPQAFFSHDQKPPVELVEEFLARIKAIQDVMCQQKKYKFFASSLLLVYDSHVVSQFKANLASLEALRQAVDVRLIDFAHAFEAHKRDDNLLSGMRNLLDLFAKYKQSLIDSYST